MTHDSKELQPCPFCGGAAKSNGHPGGMMGQVYCSNECCFGPRTTALCLSDSIRQWNTRPAPQPGMRAEGEALEYALGALRTIAASAHDTTAKQLAAIAKAGIDLAEKGADKCAEMRGDALPAASPAEEGSLQNAQGSDGSKPAPDALREAQLQQSARVLRDALVQQSRIVRNFSNPDDVFEAVPTRFITEECETTSAPPVPPPDGAAERAAPERCPHCFDETDCSNIDVCNAAADQSPAPPSDDVRSALADDLDLIGGALSKYRHPSVVTHAFYRVSAALRSAPVSAAAITDIKGFVALAVSDGEWLGRHHYVAPSETISRRERAIKIRTDSILAILCAPAVGVTREAIARAIFENLVASTDADGMPIISGINSATSAILALRSPVPDATVSARCPYCMGSGHAEFTIAERSALSDLEMKDVLAGPVSARDAVIEECAKVAENVDDVIRGGCQSADEEWLWTNGGNEMQRDIVKAIRSLIGAKPAAKTCSHGHTNWRLCHLCNSD